MYMTSQAVAALIEGSCRTFRMVLELPTGRRLPSKLIRSGQSQAYTTSCSDDIELGAVCSAQWELEVYEEDVELNIIGREVRLYLYLADLGMTGMATYGDLEVHTWDTLGHYACEDIPDLAEMVGGELIPMGEYICVRLSRTAPICRVTLADELYATDKPYHPRLPMHYTRYPLSMFPALSSDVEKDICKQLGIGNANAYRKPDDLLARGGVWLYAAGRVKLRAADYDFTIKSIPKGTTMRQMLSYIASANGQIGYVGRDGKYIRKWYGVPVKALDPDAIDTPSLSRSENTIAGIICKVSENVTLTQGDTSGSYGRVIEFENPYMHESMMLPLLQKLQTMEWSTASVRMRLGDPRVDPADVLTYTDAENTTHNIPAMSLCYTYDGGLSADVSAFGQSTDEAIDE